jgi:hypothetical protein
LCLFCIDMKKERDHDAVVAFTAELGLAFIPSLTVLSVLSYQSLTHRQS